MKVGAAIPPPAPIPARSHARKRVACAVAIACVALQAGRRLDLAALSVVIWLVTVALADGQALRRLFMPKFWGITILFALASGLLLGPRDLDVLGLRLSAQGLEAGALMVCRGLFIFALVIWASRAVDGIAARRLAEKVGLGNLGVAVGSAFGLLPALRDRLVERRQTMNGRGRPKYGELRGLVIEIMSETVRLSERVSVDIGERAALIVVSGSPGAGKSTAVMRLSEGLEAEGFEVGGVLQPAIEEQGRRLGYLLKDYSTGDERPFARRKSSGRGYDFDETGWDWAAERLGAALVASDAMVIDELGLLEADGGGHLVALHAMSQRAGRPKVLIATLREGCLESIAETLGRPALEFKAPLSDEALADALRKIVSLLDSRHH